jgi:hypothetical protein
MASVAYSARSSARRRVSRRLGNAGPLTYAVLVVVSLASLAANLVVLEILVAAGAGKVAAQAVAIVLVTPLNFAGNKLWSFRRH